MAGHGEALFNPHSFLAERVPSRFSASEEQLKDCIDEIMCLVQLRGEQESTPALAYGIESINTLNEKLGSKSWPLIMIWDGINHELKYNLGGLGVNQESEL